MAQPHINSTAGSITAAQLVWRKSSASGGGATNCVELARHPSAVLIRDSKNCLGPWLAFDASGWSAFLAEL